MITAESGTPLYQQLADSLQEQIDSGTFRVGERIPSVRRMSRDRRVSVTTVMEAYALLEDRGWIEGRSRSGYFVKWRAGDGDRLPGLARHSNRPVKVGVSDLIGRMMEASHRPEVVPFGHATPGDASFPHKRLMAIGNLLSRKKGAAVWRYSMVPGQEELRTQIAKRSLDAGIGVGPDEVVTTFGASEALVLALRACARAGDLIAVETPTYYGILDLIRKLDMRAIEIPTHPKTGMDLAAFAKSLDSHPVRACLVQPVVQNPTGAVMPESHKKMLVNLCEDAGVTLIEDSVYADLHFRERRPASLKAYDGTGNVVYCSSFSKTISPGSRVGWILPGRHMRQVRELKTASAPANCTLSEMVMAEFLRSGGFDRHLRTVRSLYQVQLEKARESVFGGFPEGTRAADPRGGFLLWVEMPKGVDAEKLACEALERSIAVVPGSLCSATGRFRNAVRINCGHPWDGRTERALETLGKLAWRQLE